MCSRWTLAVDGHHSSRTRGKDPEKLPATEHVAAIAELATAAAQDLASFVGRPMIPTVTATLGMVGD